MDFFEVIEKRSTTLEFTKDEVCKGSINSMMEAAMRAPSWKNKTSYKIIIVEETEKINKIADTILNDDNKAAKAVKSAPLVAVFIGEEEVSGDVDGKKYYIVDAAIAMEHFILAATAEGYGSFFIGCFDEESIKNILEIPSEFKVIGFTPIGSIKESSSHKKEKSVKEYVFSNKFGEKYSEK